MKAPSLSVARRVLSLSLHQIRHQSTYSCTRITTTSRRRSRPQTSKKRKPSLSYATTNDQKWKLPILIHHPPVLEPQPVVTKSISEDGESHYVNNNEHDTPRTDPRNHHQNHHRHQDQDPILLICGWGGCGTVDWGAIPSMLAHRTKRPVLTYDARGLGNSLRVLVDEDSSELVQPAEGDEDHVSMDMMASDALSVAQHYFESVRGVNGSGNNTRRRFSVGGVSMGGMVSQSLAAKLKYSTARGSTKEYTGTQECPIIISSLALICSSPLYHSTGGNRTLPFVSMTSEQSRHDSPPTLESLREDHFLLSFDDWKHECDETKIRKCRQFFDALGERFLEKPGREALRDKLIQSFISSRKDFVNGLGLNMILAQRDVILKECAGLLDDADSYQGVVTGSKSTEARRLLLEGLNIPMVVIHGREDSVIPFAHGERLYGTAAGSPCEKYSSDSRKVESSFVPIDDCDHLCWITHGHELVDIMGDFLSATPK